MIPRFKKSFLPALLFFAVLVVAVPVLTGESFRIEDRILVKAEEKYGGGARRRLLEWQELVQTDASSSDLEKLEKVNDFFNRMDFVDDILHWGQEDYWATPVEFLSSAGGDCEDFSIAKYFTLKLMGVPESRLNLTYVKALRLNQHHMVVTYYSSPGAEPLVLDNLIGFIKPASQRSDLLPIYSFNGLGLWLAKQRGRGQQVGSSSRLKRWQDLLERMPEGLH